jgi:hypothetical protein
VSAPGGGSCAEVLLALRAEDRAEVERRAGHLDACPSCRALVDGWRAIEAAAPALRREWDSPELWPRIEAALARERARSVAQARRARRVRLGAAAAVLLGLAAWATVMLRHPATPQVALERQEQERRLLTEQALAGVEAAETAYTQAIDGLARTAEPVLQDPASPLLMSYREKLALLDAAIAECRAEVARNRFNAHLRRELLSIYQEKQRTLEQVLRGNADDRS